MPPYLYTSYSMKPFREAYDTSTKLKEKVPQNREQRRLKKKGKKF